MRTTTSTRNDSAARRDLAPGAQMAQDPAQAPEATDQNDCDCDDCDCPDCYPGCC
jgi:hypothetical protein